MLARGEMGTLAVGAVVTFGCTVGAVVDNTGPIVGFVVVLFPSMVERIVIVGRNVGDINEVGTDDVVGLGVFG